MFPVDTSVSFKLEVVAVINLSQHELFEGLPFEVAVLAVGLACFARFVVTAKDNLR